MQGSVAGMTAIIHQRLGRFVLHSYLHQHGLALLRVGLSEVLAESTLSVVYMEHSYFLLFLVYRTT